tara:strand:- start:137 stop:820 length:684 start_codon:yes stop_codon:yes gene_type:complete
MRIAKYIAYAGVCSRRQAEELINNKQVKINEKICDHPSIKVGNTDKIKIKGKIIKIDDKLRLWKIYKPIKYICTNNDPQKRKKIFDLIPTNLPRLISIGRLDYMSEGLMLLTNKGDFARKLELPNNNFERIYRVCVDHKINKEDLDNINRGIVIKKIKYQKIKIIFEKKTHKYSWLVVKLKEGKNREIRNIFEYFGWNIVKLIRIQYGPYRLYNLKRGQLVEIKKIY